MTPTTSPSTRWPSKTQSEDTGKRFEAYGWDAVTIDGHDLDAIAKALANAKAERQRQARR